MGGFGLIYLFLMKLLYFYFAGNLFTGHYTAAGRAAPGHLKITHPSFLHSKFFVASQFFKIMSNILIKLFKFSIK
jgi:hypothetical protein